jgi:hypothetical protein
VLARRCALQNVESMSTFVLGQHHGPTFVAGFAESNGRGDPSDATSSDGDGDLGFAGAHSEE